MPAGRQIPFDDPVVLSGRNAVNAVRVRADGGHGAAVPFQAAEDFTAVRVRHPYPAFPPDRHVLFAVGLHLVKKQIFSVRRDFQHVGDKLMQAVGVIEPAVPFPKLFGRADPERGERVERRVNLLPVRAESRPGVPEAQNAVSFVIAEGRAGTVVLRLRRDPRLKLRGRFRELRIRRGLPDFVAAARHVLRPHPAPAPLVQALVVNGLQVVGFPFQGLRPALFRLFRHAQVQEGQRPVVQGFGGIPGGFGCGPRIVFPERAAPDLHQLFRHLPEVVGTFIGVPGQARRQQVLQRIRHRNAAAGHILPAVPPRLRPVRPGPCAQVHFQHGNRPAVQIGPPRQLHAGLLFRGTVCLCISGRSHIHGSPVAGGLRAVSGSAQLRPGVGQAEIRHFCLPVIGQEQVGGLDILVNQAVVMGVVQSPGALHCNIQQPLLHFPFASAVQHSVPDAACQVAVLHPFGKNRRHPADLADIVAGNDIRVQAEIDPVFTFVNELFLFPVPSLGEEPRLRAFHGQVCTPAFVAHAPHAAHAAVDGVAFHPVGFKENIARGNLLVGNGGGTAARDLVGRVVQVRLAERFALVNADLRQAVAQAEIFHGNTSLSSAQFVMRWPYCMKMSRNCRFLRIGCANRRAWRRFFF